jgi:hypothetical protein
METDATVWATNLPDEFERRRGYPIWEHLPALIDLNGREAFRLGDAELTRRARYDYEEVLTELYIQHHLEPLKMWAHSIGMTLRVQPAGLRTDSMIKAAIVDVPEGESANVIADPAGFDPAEAHVVVGAHLATVPQAPGAEDNASGVAVMLELARMAAAEPPATPVRFIAFGAEEPRGPGDDLHHFGSQQYVADMPAAEREAMVAMVSLDRVGVAADQVPVCTGGTGTTSVLDALIDAADDAGVPAEPCENRASDHWSFEKADLPAARLGSVPYAGYHSPDDVPSVIDIDQLDRVGRIMWSWMAGH